MDIDSQKEAKSQKQRALNKSFSFILKQGESLPLLNSWVFFFCKEVLVTVL